MIARPPSDNEARLEALRRYAILDTPVEPDFEAITALASAICGVPIAQITFVDEHRQWFKSVTGMEERETSLESSACAHAILGREFLVVPDMCADERFSDNPLVTGEPHVRFYAGALLMTPDGFPLGTMCVLDFEPRQLTDTQRDLLQLLARKVMNMLELRRQSMLEREAQARLLAELSLRKEILGIVTHDLRSPLSVIKMVADLSAENRPGADPGLTMMSGYLKDAVTDMERLLEDLSDYSIIEQGRLSMHLQPFDAREILENVIRRSALKTEAAGISLNWTEGINEAVTVVCDPGRLGQVLENLVSNAVKFTPRGGRITLTLKREDPWVTIAVADTGKGIAPDQLDRIFERFWTDQESGLGGRGLGLTIVQAIVEAHGGSVSVTSDGGKGSCFLVRLPIGLAALA